MKRIASIRALTLACVAVAAVACSASPPLTPLPPPPPPASAAPAPAASSAVWVPATDAPFRQHAPEAGPTPAWSAPVPAEHRLSNGMSVLIVQRSELPIVVVQLVSRRGADQQRMAGLGSFTGRMIEQGTKTRSALQVSDDFESIGAEHGTWVGWDSTNAWLKVLPRELDKGLEILADVVENPAFSEDEIARVRSQQLATWKQMLDVPHYLLARTVARTLFANQPYGNILLGDEDSIKRIKRQDIVSFYDDVMVPADTAIVVVGNVEPDAVVAKLEKAFGSWKRAGGPAIKVRKPAPPARTIVLVDEPGAPQSNIAVAGIGADRTAKDYDAIEVANTIFGGMFSSRLNLNLREKHAYTYGARSQFDFRHSAGPFVAAAAVDTPNTGPALSQMIDELQAFCSAPVKPEEINLALGQLIKSMPGDFESDSAAASQIADLWVYGLPLDTYRTQAARFSQVTADDVQRVAATRMALGGSVIVVVGDKKAVLPQLEALRFGPIKVMDKQGKLLETVSGKGGYVGYACKMPAPQASAAPAKHPAPPAKPPAPHAAGNKTPPPAPKKH